MNIIIIDDQKETRNNLRKLLQLFCPQINVLGSASNSTEGIQLIVSTNPDLVFLDVNISMNGIFETVLKAPGRKFQTVILAAHDKYALQAIKMNALDYLLKPVDHRLLVNCMQKAFQKSRDFVQGNTTLTNSALKRNQTDKLGIPTCNGIRYLALQEILYFKSHDNYTEIVMEQGKPLLISKSLKSFEKILADTSFTRVHQSYLVNMEKIVELQRIGGGILILNNNSKVPISRAKKDIVRKQLEESWRMI